MLYKSVYFDVHDLIPNLSSFDTLLALREHYPNFKITCFCIPDPDKEYCKKLGIEKEYNLQVLREWARTINLFTWIEVGVHGFTHTKYEMDCSYKEACICLDGAEDRLKYIGLDYKKIFVAPYWRYSRGAMEALRDKGYVVEFRKRPRLVLQGLRHYSPNWFFDRSLPQTETLFGNGHLTSFKVRDGVERCFERIVKLIPQDTQFNFISNLYESEA